MPSVGYLPSITPGVSSDLAHAAVNQQLARDCVLRLVRGKVHYRVGDLFCRPKRFVGTNPLNRTSPNVILCLVSSEAITNRLLHTQNLKKENMMSTLKDKAVLVTGASRGIGAAIAKRLAAEGANVAITYAKDVRAAEAVVKAIESSGRKALAIQADAADPMAVKSAVDQTAKAFGKIDVLVNNAGTAIPKPFEETTLEEMDQMIDLNFRGVLVATQAALKHMPDGGRIISIGSCVGERNMTPGLAAYAATKGAVKMFTQGLAREVGRRAITVNNVQPGPIDTDLNPASGDWAAPQLANTALNRYGQVDEVAALVAFVASPEAAYITGANLTIDGGTNA